MATTCKITDTLRIVRGNAFAIKVNVKALRPDGTEIQDFSLADSDAVALITVGQNQMPTPFEVEGNAAVITFDGHQQQGVYGIDMSGVFRDEKWRFCSRLLFEIVETTAQANIPAGCILYDDTYIVGANITLYTMGPQADWTETDPLKQSYIKHKPNLTVYATNEALEQGLSGKQDTIDDLQNIRNGSAAGATAYQKPAGGIPESDLDAAAQQKIDSGASAYQKPVGGIPKSDLDSSVQASLGKADTAIQDVTQIEQDIDNLEALVPAQASPQNQLADKNFVNSSIATNTATYRGAYNLVSDLSLTVSATEQQIASALATKMAALSITPENNDYCFVQIPTANDKPTEIARVDRYKFNGTAWSFEFSLNNSGFTAAQWAALNSGITSGLVTKLGDLPTNSELTTLLSGKADKSNTYTKTEVDELDTLIKNRVLYMEQCFGKYDTKREITLSQAKSGKYVDVSGQEATASGYGISNSIEVLAGDILLIPSAQAVPADVSVVARIVTRTYQKVIGYTYTYQQANPELYDTATADYDQTLVYTAVYDTSGETPQLTGWTRNGQTYQTLPATREVTDSFYEPLVKQSTSAMPSTGYYIYLCPTPMTVVISGLTATVDGGVCLAVGWGIFKNICTNFVGAPGQAVLAQAFAQMQAEIDGLRAQLENLGETKAVCIDSENLPKVCGQSLVIQGTGAPSVVPMFIGQHYQDTTNNKIYEAIAVTNSTNNWKLLN